MTPTPMLFIGTGVPAVEIEQVHRRRVHWRFLGLTRWFIARSRAEALLHAAWSMKKRGIDCDWTLQRATREPLRVVRERRLP